MANAIYDVEADEDFLSTHFKEQYAVDQYISEAPLLAPPSYVKQGIEKRTYCLYVTDLKKGLYEKNIKVLFSQFGKVESCHYNGARNFAFVEFAQYTAAEIALATLDRKPPLFLTVKWKREPKQRDELKAAAEAVSEMKVVTERDRLWKQIQDLALCQSIVGYRSDSSVNASSPLQTEEKLPVLGRGSKLPSQEKRLLSLGRSKVLRSPQSTLDEETTFATETSRPSPPDDREPKSGNLATLSHSFTALVSHVEFPGLHIIREENIDKLVSLKQQLQDHCKKSSARIPIHPALFDIVAGRFEEDQQWYRCRITGINEETQTYQLYFLDFGNQQDTKGTDMREITSELSVATIPALAMNCQLYAEPDETLPEDSREVLEPLVGCRVKAEVVEEGPVHFIKLCYKEHDLNKILLTTS